MSPSHEVSPPVSGCLNPGRGRTSPLRTSVFLQRPSQKALGALQRWPAFRSRAGAVMNCQSEAVARNCVCLELLWTVIERRISLCLSKRGHASSRCCRNINDSGNGEGNASGSLGHLERDFRRRQENHTCASPPPGGKDPAAGEAVEGRVYPRCDARGTLLQGRARPPELVSHLYAAKSNVSVRSPDAPTHIPASARIPGRVPRSRVHTSRLGLLLLRLRGASWGSRARVSRMK